MFPRWFKDIPLFWPVAATAAGVIVTAASANTRLADLTDRVNYIWTVGTPAETPTLARIDERQLAMSRTLEQIDHKIDEMDTRVRDNGAYARSARSHR